MLDTSLIHVTVRNLIVAAMTAMAVVTVVTIIIAAIVLIVELVAPPVWCRLSDRWNSRPVAFFLQCYRVVEGCHCVSTDSGR